jgi:PAS domain S-box-containing protein
LRDSLSAAEAAIRAGEERLALASAAAGIGVFDFDIRTRRKIVTQEYLSVYGLPPGEQVIDSERWSQLLHPKDRERVLAKARATIAAGTTYQDEFRILRPDTGEQRWIASHGRVLTESARFVGIVRDVTERRQAEDHYRALVEVSPQVVWMADEHGQIIYANTYWLDFTGLTLQDSVGDGWTIPIHPDDRADAAAAFRAAVLDALAGGPGHYVAEFRIRRAADGAYHWFYSKGVPLRDEEGNVARWVGIGLDIHDRREAEERRELLAREVDHRARNVLAVVRAIVRLTRAEDPRHFAEAVEGRVAALARAHTLLARESWTGVDLGELIRDELAAYEGKGRLLITGPLLRLRAEVVQPLSMVVHELTTNAAKYGALSLPGGRVEVSWHLQAQGGAPPRHDHGAAAALGRIRWSCTCRAARASGLRLHRHRGDSDEPARRHRRVALEPRGAALHHRLAARPCARRRNLGRHEAGTLSPLHGREGPARGGFAAGAARPGRGG